MSSKQMLKIVSRKNLNTYLKNVKYIYKINVTDVYKKVQRVYKKKT